MRARGHRGLGWLAAGAGLAVAASTVLAMAPAHAGPATVDAQLSLSGVATQANVLGGKTVGAHPGDTVDFRAAAVPTAGLDGIPALGPLLRSVLDTLGGQFQVVATFAQDVPGVGGTKVTLGGPTSGKCAGRSVLPVTFPDAGNYAFSWTVQYVLPGLFGCTKNGLNSTAINQLRQAGIAINASNQWVGQVTVAQDPPKGGVSVQLPGVGASPSLPVVGQLPGVSLPPVSLPTLPVTVPSLGTLPIPGLGGSSEPAGAADTSGKHAAPPPTWTPPALSIPEQVVPSSYGPQQSAAGGDASGRSGPAAPPDQVHSGAAANEASPATAHDSAKTTPSPTRTVPAAALLSAATTDGHGQSMPVLLAIVAIIALSLVTALYARMYLLQRK